MKIYPSAVTKDKQILASIDGAWFYLFVVVGCWKFPFWIYQKKKKLK